MSQTPGPPFAISVRAADHLAKIIESITRLELGTEFRLDIRLHRENRVRSIYSSLVIEGNRLSLAQVSDVLNGQPVWGRPADIQEVRNAVRHLRQRLLKAAQRIKRVARRVGGEPLPQHLAERDEGVDPDMGVAGDPLAATDTPDADGRLHQEQPYLIGRVGQRWWRRGRDVTTVEQHLTVRITDHPGLPRAELTQQAIGVDRDSPVVALPRGEHQVFAIGQEGPTPPQFRRGYRCQELDEVQVAPVVPACGRGGSRRSEHRQRRHPGGLLTHRLQCSDPRLQVTHDSRLGREPRGRGSPYGLDEVHQLVTAGGRPARFVVAVPGVETNIGGAVLAGEQAHLANLGGHGLGVEEKPGADTLTLPVGCDDKSSEFDRGARTPQPGRSYQPAVVANAEGDDGGICEFFFEVGQGLCQRRKIEVVVGRGFCHVRGSLKGEDFSGVVWAEDDDGGQCSPVQIVERAAMAHTTMLRSPQARGRKRATTWE